MTRGSVPCSEVTVEDFHCIQIIDSSVRIQSIEARFTSINLIVQHIRWIALSVFFFLL